MRYTGDATNKPRLVVASAQGHFWFDLSFPFW